MNKEKIKEGEMSYLECADAMDVIDTRKQVWKDIPKIMPSDYKFADSGDYKFCLQQLYAQAIELDEFVKK